MLQQLLTDEDWKLRLASILNSEEGRGLESFLETEWKENIICPPKHMIFNAFNITPFESVRVVIIGQDPYHTIDVAMGLSFSVKAGKTIPPSLKNIFQEIETDLGIGASKNGDLTKCSEQGVLLLNAVLTVRKGQANSHADKGWEAVTCAAISALSEHREKIVFVLWGRYAQRLENLIDNSKHLVLKSAHPSPYSAASGFFGCKHFSKTNEYLADIGEKPIDWTIETSSSE